MHFALAEKSREETLDHGYILEKNRKFLGGSDEALFVEEH
jgi:hypothetical protein